MKNRMNNLSRVNSVLLLFAACFACIGLSGGAGAEEQRIKLKLVKIAEVSEGIPAKKRGELEARRQELGETQRRIVDRAGEFNQRPAQKQSQRDLNALSREAESLNTAVRKFNADVEGAAGGGSAPYVITVRHPEKTNNEWREVLRDTDKKYVDGVHRQWIEKQKNEGYEVRLSKEESGRTR